VLPQGRSAGVPLTGEAVTPIFIFSLPRSGSTLTQRLLASHDKVATSSEPWLLLPFLYTLREPGCYSEFGHYLMVSGVKDFCRELPGGEEDYRGAVRQLALDLYAKAAGGDATHFVDKTPRYHLIVDEIVALFPEGKFIFLWRNPLAVIASIVETFGKGRWILYVLKVDLFDGVRKLVAACQRHGEQSLSVRYEALVTDPESEARRLFAHLGLDFDAAVLQKVGQLRLKGRLGDSAGPESYRDISQEPLQKWKYVLANPLRKWWCRRYLRWIGRERLAAMGYELDDLLTELAEVPFSTRYLLSDAVQLLFGVVYVWLEPAILRDKLKRLPQLWRIHGHR
jgi:hypothetical protein